MTCTCNTPFNRSEMHRTYAKATCEAHGLQALEAENAALRKTIAAAKAWRDKMHHYGCNHYEGDCFAPAAFHFDGVRVQNMFVELDAALAGEDGEAV